MPDPKTKFDHHQINTLLELLMPKIEGLNKGDSVILKIKEDNFSFTV